MKDLKIYQQIFLYITPILTNLGFVNIIVVVVRLRWFSKRFKDLGMTTLLQGSSRLSINARVVTKKPEAIQGNHKQVFKKYAGTRDMEEGLTGDTVMPK